MKVLKFGGTSVGSAENMRKVANIIRREGSTLTVLSAMSGTTDALVKICALAKQGQQKGVPSIVEGLVQKYTTCIDGLLTGERRQAAMDRMNEVFERIHREAQQYGPGASDKVIQAQGELLTSFIFNQYLSEEGERSALLNAPEFMLSGADGKVDQAQLKAILGAQTQAPDTYYITQGFICTNDKGQLDNLGRGGSDYSAALMGVAIGADEVQIWTDIDGMHNNDPRYVEKTYPIRHMTFDDAAELAYFGAKILHPSTIQPCKEHGIPVRLKNTMDPEAPGTLITNEGDDSLFSAVAAKDNITVIRIHSLRMLMAYGFLRKVFEIFEEHRTSIDMITTSEVSVSLTIDNDEHLEAIVAELKKLGTIEIERDNSIICIVGDLDHQKAGLVWRISGSLNTIPVKMISYGASHRSMVMLIATENKIKALQDINHGLFNL
ncbi:MAG: aspartate kinase [Rikenellaceae bacterium]|nr:aspartate kinase [Rikenellaceae bacterium]